MRDLLRAVVALAFVFSACVALRGQQSTTQRVVETTPSEKAYPSIFIMGPILKKPCSLVGAVDVGRALGGEAKQLREITPSQSAAKPESLCEWTVKTAATTDHVVHLKIRRASDVGKDSEEVWRIRLQAEHWTFTPTGSGC